MAELEIGSSLCGDLARLALQLGDGGLRRAGTLVIALRAALLLDLALCGAIDIPIGRDGVAMDAGALERGTLYLDTTPTGCTVADQLLDYVRRHPSRTIDDVLRRGRPHLAAVTDELVRDGLWTRRHRITGRRWRDAESERFVALRRHVDDLITGRATPTSEREAALAAIADVLALVHFRDVDEPASPLLLDGLGSIAWLGRDVVEYLRTIRIRRGMGASLTGGGG